MFIHKYKVSGDLIYRISSESAKPGSITLKQDSWLEKRPITGSMESGLKMIAKAFKEPEKEPEKKEFKKKSIVEEIRGYVASLVKE